MKLLPLLLLLLLLPFASAAPGHLKLVAVSETNQGFLGTTADLYLTIQRGSGRVFIDTFPLMKLDTQISTRFANEVACSQLDANCDGFDFFYTIRSGSALIAGPSAGAALTALTMAELKGWPVDEKVTITGTINAGGIIGNVAGLKEKIDAAADAGITTLIVPEGESIMINNQSVSLPDYGTKRGINVVEAMDINDAVFKLTGKRVKQADGPLVIDPEYAKIMHGLASELCSRSSQLLVNSSVEGINLTKKGRAALENGSYYSAASFCFGANVRFTNAVLSNWTVEELAAFRLKLLDNITQFEYTLPKYKTLTDIQAYAAVKERLSEARDYANYTVNQTSDSYRLAYAQERLYSAGSWSKFFGTGGYELTITDPQLKEFCIAKISEVEERLQYLEIYLPTAVRGSRQDLDLAYKELAAGNYGLCIFKASKSKADADVVLGLFGIEQSQLGSLLDKKLEIIRQSIVRASKKGYFPIVGYSYYDYAKSLKSSDKYSSLLYAEYALELSNLDMYIKKQSSLILQPVQPSTPALIALGFFAGVLVCSIVFGILFLRRGKRIKRSHKNLVLRNAIHQRKARSK